jgi:ribosomal protein S18 acetylase RimI-like enzyme
LIIKTIKALDHETIDEIRQAEQACNEHDGLKGSIHLDTSFNFTDQINSVFIGHEDGRIVSVLSMFIPTIKEAEVYGFTLPGFRRRNYFKELLLQAIKELLKHGIKNILFVVESQSSTGIALSARLNSFYVKTEYLMTYTGAGSDFSKTNRFRSKLTSPGEESIEELVKMRQATFNGDYDETKSILSNIINLNNRVQYCTEYEGTRIGLGSAYFEELKASVYGLGIMPEYQAKGFGRELLLLIIEDLRTRGFSTIEIEVESNNENALNLYKKCGFEISCAYEYHRLNNLV